MKNHIKNYGFDPKLIEITPDNYVLGGGQLPKVVLRPDGQWDDWLPVYEPQAEKYETYGCTVWGALNQIEILHKLLYGVEPNYAERFNYILAGIKPPGANPHVSYETVRNRGAVSQELLPVTETLYDFVRPDPMEEKYLAEGRRWLERYKYLHEWILEGEKIGNEQRIAIIKEYLTYGPVALSVTAWYEENGLYVDRGQPNTHWVVCYGFNDKGFKIFDSYDHSKKVISYDHQTSFAKRIVISKRTVPRRFSLLDYLRRLFYSINAAL